MIAVSIIVTQVLIFVGLVFMFRRIMSRNVISATKHLDELSEEYTRKENEADKHLAEAKKKYEQTLSKARSEAQSHKAEIVKAAEEEKERVLKQARLRSEQIIQQADRSREALLSELDERIRKESVDRACELIRDTLPERFKKDVHAHWINDQIANGFNGLDTLRIPDSVREANVVTAFALSADERRALVKKLKIMLNRDMAIKEEVDPKLVAGVIVNIGNLVMDGSFRDKIRERASEAKETEA